MRESPGRANDPASYERLDRCGHGRFVLSLFGLWFGVPARSKTSCPSPNKVKHGSRYSFALLCNQHHFNFFQRVIRTALMAAEVLRLVYDVIALFCVD
jgi:hypothetical protein